MISLFCVMGIDRDITDPNLIRHFLDFYTRQRIDDYHIILQSNRHDVERYTEVTGILNSFHLEAKGHWTGEYTSPRLHRHLFETFRRGDPGDWWVVVDLDEFANFPRPAGPFLEACDSGGFNCVRGRIVDRVDDRGRLKAVRGDVPIDLQFPCEATVTRDVARGNTDKIVACKPPLIPGMGHHAIVKRARTARFHPQTLDVHHFKWDALVLERTRRRHLRYRRDRIKWRGESARLLAYLERHGRIADEHLSPRTHSALRYHTPSPPHDAPAASRRDP